MSGLGKRQAGEAHNWIFGKTPATTPAGIIYVDLHEDDPGEDGQSGTPASGGGHARVATAPADWNVATDADPAVTDNANTVTFPAATGNWNGGANFTHFTLWNSPTGDTEADYIGSGELGTAKPVLSADIPEFAAGDLSMAID